MVDEPGTIILVHFPFTDNTLAKLRPALVVSAAAFNKGEDLIAAAISSRIVANDPFGYELRSTSPGFTQTGLRGDSTIKWTKLMTINRRVIDREIGEVTKDILAEVLERIRRIFSPR